MSSQPIYEALFVKQNACVLVPTYNNQGTIGEVLSSILEYTHRVIVVNDGSTDNTNEILKQFPQIHIVSYAPNKGKGIALRTGFKEAAKLGYDYAITMDSDGQHYAKDLNKFLEQLELTPGALIVGARNMDQSHIPTKSSFGNRFSNFWYWVNTGRTLPDTQSGYRCYPLKLADRTYFTRKFEFEIEVIVVASWSGIPVISIPVSVYYPSPEERVSHFRPFKDFTRISVLNTVLVLIALIWIKPRDFVRMLSKKEGWKTMWRMMFVNPEESNHRKAASVGFGFFMGVVPVWGFQLLIGIPSAIALKLNKALFLLAANISIAPFTAFWWVASFVIGKWVLGHETLWLDPSKVSLDQLKGDALAFFLGGTLLAIALAITGYLITYFSLLLFRKRVPAAKV